eukprot:7687521-Pyramimonas_sp.AAC.1
MTSQSPLSFARRVGQQHGTAGMRIATSAHQEISEQDTVFYAPGGCLVGSPEELEPTRTQSRF